MMAVTRRTLSFISNKRSSCVRSSPDGNMSHHGCLSRPVPTSSSILYMNDFCEELPVVRCNVVGFLLSLYD